MVSQNERDENNTYRHGPIAAPKWNIWILLALVIVQVLFFIFARRHAINFFVVIFAYIFWVLRGYTGQTITPSVICLFLGGSLLINGWQAAEQIELFSKLFIGLCILIWGLVFAYAKYRNVAYNREKTEQEWQKKGAKAVQGATEDVHPYD